MPNNTIIAANKMSDANKGQASQALIIQTYANSVLAQPKVNFKGFKTLAQYQKEINSGLKTAK